jgi:tetratricopeptide (TPR) repeat protein
MKPEKDSQPPETGDIEVGDVKDSQGIAIGPGARAKVVAGDEVHGDKVAGNKVTQLIANVPLWLWAIVALAILVPLGFWVVPRLLPPFRPAAEGETLIIVAKFDDRSQGTFRGVDPSSRIYDFILKAAQEHKTSNVRVERLEETVTNSQDAQAAGNHYRANLVIWGWYDSLGVQPYVELIGQRTVQGEGVAIQTPTPMAFYFRDEIPAQSAYLGLFTLGMTHIAVNSPAELRQAIAFFDAALGSVMEGAHITPWEAYIWRANCYALLGEYDVALQDYNRALELNPGDASGFHNRAVTHFHLGDHQAAIADYTQAIHIEPDLTIAYFNRAISHSSLGDHQAAVADYTEAIRIKPDYAEAYFNRAAAYKDLGDQSAAIADYTQAVRIKPDYADAYFNRAIAHSNLGDDEAAIADYTEAIRIKPDYAEAYIGRAAAHINRGEYKVAVADYTEAIRIKPDDADAYHNRAIAHSNLGDDEAAIADYTEAIRIKPDYAEAYIGRAAVHIDLREHEAAVADYTEAIRIKPDYAEAYFGRAVARMALGRDREAIADFERHQELGTDAYWRSQAERHLKELRSKLAP